MKQTETMWWTNFKCQKIGFLNLCSVGCSAGCSAGSQQVFREKPSGQLKFNQFTNIYRFSAEIEAKRCSGTCLCSSRLSRLSLLVGSWPERLHDGTVRTLARSPTRSHARSHARTHARTHAPTHARSHARALARTRARTRTRTCYSHNYFYSKVFTLRIFNVWFVSYDMIE